MTVSEIFKLCRENGIKLSLNGDKLRVAASHQKIAPEIAALLKANKDAIVSFLAELQGDGVSSAIVPVGQDTPKVLSFAQQRMWFLNQFMGPNAVYNMSLGLRFGDTVSPALMAACIQRIFERHESLRSCVINDESEPLIQLLQSAPALKLEWVANEQELRAIVEQEHHRAFDVNSDPLCRVRLLRLGQSPQEAGDLILHVTMHHIISDAWSLGVFCRELMALYQANPGLITEQNTDALHPEALNTSELMAKLNDPLPALAIQYSDYAHWQKAQLQGDALQPQLRYWRDQLAGLPPVLTLPTDKPRPAKQTVNGAMVSRQLPLSLLQGLEKLGKAHECTLFMTTQAAFAVLLSRYSGQRDLAIGTPVANRTQTDTQDLIGFFVNTVVLRHQLTSQTTFNQLLSQSRSTVLNAFANQDVPFERLVETLNPERNLSHSPLFQVMFVMQNVPNQGMALDGITISDQLYTQSTEAEPDQTTATGARFDLTLTVYESPQGLVTHLEYNTDLFDAATMTRLLAHYQTLLEALVSAPECSVFEHALLSEAEVAMQLSERTVVIQSEPTLLVHQQVAQCAVAQPQAVALRHGDITLSYAELNQRANQLAHYLIQQGVSTEDRIALCLDRCINMVVAVLAVLKTGAAYVPIAIDVPAKRKQFIIQDAKASCVIAHGKDDPEQLDFSVPVVLLDKTLAFSDEQATLANTNPDVAVHADNLAYIIYTSGSTGQPKGTLVPHRNICRLFTSTARDFGFNQQDVWTLFHSYAFDFSVWEMWGALIHGGELVIVPAQTTRSVAAFYELLVDCRVTVLNQTPSMFYQVLEYDQQQPQQQASSDALALRWVIFGGEALDTRKLAPWFARHSDEKIPLVNMYGITETTVHVTHHPLTADQVNVADMGDIGRPLTDLSAYVLDDNLRLVPAGVVGELYVGGAGLARGYLNRSALTAERFVPDPFSVNRGARLYRTGDLARFLPNGNLAYSGRADQQVKVRGFRIETGEIAHCIAQHASVKDCVVVAHQHHGDTRLVAYVVGDGDADDLSDDTHNRLSLDHSEALRAFVAQSLPAYMIPAAFVPLATLPLTQNGKLNIKALPAPQFTQQRREFEAPQGEVEHQLSLLWQEVLPMEQSADDMVRIDRRDNFFNLGGHSLLVTQLASRIRAQFATDIGIQSLFEQQTLTAQALLIAQTASSKEHALLQPVSREHPLALSFAQQRLWFLSQHMSQSQVYNLPMALRLRGEVKEEALIHSLEAIIARHEALRTRFVATSSELSDSIEQSSFEKQSVIQVIDAELAPIVVEHCHSVDELQRIVLQERHFHFDLGKDHLCRIRLLQATDELAQTQPGYVLLVTMHHVISDGWSLGIFFKELTALYHAFTQQQPSPLAPLSVQYADFAQWQRQWLNDSMVQQQLSYWRKQLQGLPPLITLPANRPRPEEQTFNGSNLALHLPLNLSRQLLNFSQAQGCTLFMTLLGAFFVLLSRFSGHRDLAIGTPVANRTRKETESLIGFFVNTLVMRCQLDDTLSFTQLLQQVRTTSLAGYEHQDIPFEHLIEALNPVRNTSHSPLFQVMFSLQNTPVEVVESGDLQFTPLQTQSVHDQEKGEQSQGVARFDLTLNLQETDSGIVGAMEYNTDLFDPDTIALFLEHYQQLLQQLMTTPELPVLQVPLLAAHQYRDKTQQVQDYWQTPAVSSLQNTLNIAPSLLRQASAIAPELQALTASSELARSELAKPEIEGKAAVAVWVQNPSHTQSRALAASALLAALQTQTPCLFLAADTPLLRLQYELEAYNIGCLLCDDVQYQKVHTQLGALPGFAEKVRYVSLTEVVNQASLEWEQVADERADESSLPQGLQMRSDAPALILPACFSHAHAQAFSKQPSQEPSKATLTLTQAQLLAWCSPNHPERRGLMEQWQSRRAAETLGFCTQVLFGEAPRDTSEPLRLPDNMGCVINTAASACLPVADELLNVVLPQGAVGELCIPASLASLDLAKLVDVKPDASNGSSQPNTSQLSTSKPSLEQYINTGIRAIQRADGLHWVSTVNEAPNDAPDPQGLLVVDDTLTRRLQNVSAQNNDTLWLARHKYERQVMNGYVSVQPAYYVVYQQDNTDTAADTSTLCALSEHVNALRTGATLAPLPSYQVVLDTLPKVHGQPNVKALPLPEKSSNKPAFEAPVSEQEIALAEIWQSLLDIDAVGRLDNYFDLGGHSLITVKMVEQLRQRGFKANVKDIFSAQTLAELALALAPLNDDEVPPNLIPAQCDSLTPDMVNLISLTPDELRNIERNVPGHAQNIQDIYPLTPMQEGFLLHSLMSTEGDTYVLSWLLSTRTRTRLDALLSAIQQIVNRHDIFRSAVLWEGLPKPVQVVYREAPLIIDEFQLNPAQDPLSQLKKRIRHSRINMQRAPLLQIEVAPDPHSLKWFVVLKIHHMIDDYRTLEMFVAELMAHLSDEQDQLQPPVPYRNVVSRILSYVDKGDGERYFRKKLKGVQEPTLPFNINDVHIDGGTTEHCRRTLEPELCRAIFALAKQARVLPASIFHTAWALVAAKCSGRNDVVFGTVLLGRMQGTEGGDRAMGMFLNTLPLRIRLNQLDVENAILTTHAELTELMQHEMAPLPLAQRCSEVENDTPLFNSIYNFRHNTEAEEQMKKSEQERNGVPRSFGLRVLKVNETTNYPLAISTDQVADTFHLDGMVDSRIGAERVISYLHTALKNVVEAATKNPQQRFLHLSVEPQAQRLQQLNDWNQTNAPFNAQLTMPDWFEQQVDATPDACALIFDSQHMSYAELDKRANGLAHRLIEAGVKADMPVGLCAHRSVDMVIGMLAIFKAGGAYVPLDPEYPPQRLAYVTQNSGIAHVLLGAGIAKDQIQEFTDQTQNQNQNQNKNNRPQVLMLSDVITSQTQRPGLPVDSRQLAYVIYTSGSTGRPKGVGISHQALVNRLVWMAKQYQFSSHDRVLQKTPYSFDVSVWEFFLPLVTGAGLVIAKPDGHKDPLYVQTVIEQQQVSVLHFVPSMLNGFLTATQWEQQPGRCSSVRQVVCSGEALPIELQQRFFARPAHQATPQLANLYGPTEAAIDVTYWHCSPNSALNVVPIGRAIHNIRLYVLDDALMPVPTGCNGQLYIGGVGLARGYVNQAGLTAERFIPDPHSNTPGARLYATGDLVRLLNDHPHQGNIEYLGRIDQQVKIRGFRIELGEIEHAITQTQAVNSSKVVKQTLPNSNDALVAYHTLNAAHAPVASRTLALKAQHKIEADQLFTLPNQLAVCGVNKRETLFLYEEIFAHNSYFRHGITLNEGAVVFDVGANIGMFSIYLASRFQAITVHAFEPVTPVFQALNNNSFMFGGDKIVPHSLGMWHEPGQTEFSYYLNDTIVSGIDTDPDNVADTVKAFVKSDSENRISGEVTDEQWQQLIDERLQKQKVQVRLTTVSEQIRQQGIRRIDLLKVDVEGSELNVLQGIDDEHWSLIQQLVIEVHDVDNAVARTVSLLQSHQFEVAVDKDESLADTHLYNLYARKHAAEAKATTMPPVQPSALGLPAIEAQITHTLTQQLPAHMLPAFHVFLTEMPVTANGKIDLRALPLPQTDSRSSDWVAPQNETEQRLCQIWQQVLGSDNIGVEDDFFMIGGDSILLIQVVSRARSQNMTIQVQDVFRYRTIRELAKHVKAVRLALDQSPSTGKMPLLPIHHRFYQSAMPTPDYYHQSQLLQVPEALNLAFLQQFAAAMYQRHDALRLQYINQDGEFCGMFNDNTDALVASSVQQVNLQGNTEQDCHDEIQQVGGDIKRSIHLATGPLMKLVLLESASLQQKSVLMVLHHLLVDSVSWRIIFDDITLAFQQWQGDAGIALGLKTSTYQHFAQALNSDTRQDQLRGALGYWRAMHDPAQHACRSIIPDIAPEKVQSNLGTQQDQAQVTFELSEAQTQALLTQAGKRYRTQPLELMLAGLALAFAQWHGSSQVRVDLEGHGREQALFDNMDLSETLGWFTSIYPVCLPATDAFSDTPSEQAIAELIIAVKERMRSVEHRGLDYGVLRYLTQDRELVQLANANPSQVMFNYLGQFDQVHHQDALFRPVQVPSGADIDPHCPRDYLLDVISMVTDGRLHFVLGYSRRHFHAERIEKLAQLIAKGCEQVIAHCIEPVPARYTPSDFPLIAVSQSQLDSLVAQYPSLHALYPTTSLQMGLIFQSMLDQSSQAYSTQLYIDFEGDFNLTMFQQAWAETMSRHSALRTAFFALNQDQHIQVVQEQVSIPWIVEDWRTGDEFAQQEQAQALLNGRFEQFRAQDKRKGFDFNKPPLMRMSVIRLSEQRYRWLWTHHHSLLDGWSVPIVLNDVFSDYLSRFAGVAHNPEKAVWYEDYYRWVTTQDHTATKAYWQQQLGGFEHATRLGIDSGIKTKHGDSQAETETQTNTQTDVAVNVRQQAQLQFDLASSQALQQRARKAGVTLNTVIQGAWAYLLSLYSGDNRVMFGQTVSGRPSQVENVEKMVGLFINSLPVCVDIPTNSGLDEWLQQIHQGQLEREQNGYLSLREIQAQSSIAPGQPLFDSIIVFENYPVGEKLKESNIDFKALLGFEMQSVGNDEGTDFPLEVLVMPAEALTITLSWADNAYQSQLMHALAARFELILRAFINDPVTQVQQLPCLSESEQQQQFVAWNQTDVAFNQAMSIPAWFEAQVDATPHATALLFDGAHLSYSELDKRANRLANRLLAAGMQADAPVGLCAHRSFEMVIGMLAIVKAGGAYVPLDPDYPAQRLAYVVQNSHIENVLVTQALRAQLTDALAQDSVNTTLNVMLLSDTHLQGEMQSERRPNVSIDTAQLAYVIYTSGSTGTPKGVGISHKALVNRLEWMQQTYSLVPSDRVLQKTPYSFDVSVWEFFWPLLTGAGLVIAKPDGHKDPHYLQQIIEQQQVSVLHFVPSMLNAFLSAIDWEHNESVCASLRQVVCSGEALSPAVQARFYQPKHAQQCGLANLYGPTEAAIDVSYWHCEAQRSLASVPIGRAINNIRLYVLNDALAGMPVGCHGQLYIGGVGLARGYVNKPSLTAERFIPDPHSQTPGARMYATGDLVRFITDDIDTTEANGNSGGNIEYLSRIDHQVKIRGLRIELGEIEQVLLQLTPVKQAVVIHTVADSGHGVLAAYLVPVESSVTSEAASTSETIKALAKQHLVSQLPDYMVPGFFAVLEALPTTANGKLDRQALTVQALAAQAQPAFDATHPYQPPSTTLEMQLCRLFEQVLGVSNIGVNANFFTMGGDSIRSISLVTEGQKRGLAFSVKDVFDHPDIAGLAASIQAGAATQHRVANVPPFSLVSPEQKQRVLAQFSDQFGEQFNQQALDDIFPLSMLQQGMVVHSQRNPDLNVYHDVLFYQFSASWQQEDFARAIKQVAERHGILRTVLQINQDPPLQMVFRERVPSFSHTDLCAMLPEQQQQHISQWVSEQCDTGFDFTQQPLNIHVFQLGEAQMLIGMSFHHALLDGWSVANLVAELFTVYQGFSQAPDHASVQNQSADVPPSYRYFVAEEQRALASSANREYWQQRFENVQLPWWTGDLAQASVGMSWQLSGQKAQAFTQLAQSLGVQEKALWASVYLALVGLLDGQSSALGSLVVHGRPEIAHSDKTLGLFLTTLPVRVDMAHSSWRNFIYAVNQELLSLQAQRHFPLIEVQALTGLDFSASMFNYVNFHVYAEQDIDQHVAGLGGVEETNYRLTFQVSKNESNQSHQLHLNVDPSVFNDTLRSQMLSFVERIVDAMLANPEASIDKARLLAITQPATPAGAAPAQLELSSSLLDLQAELDSHAENGAIHHMVEQVAQAHPHCIAVMANDATGPVAISYGELNARANQLAHYLLAHHLPEKQVKPDTLVAVCMPRSVAFMVSILAVLKTGAAYLPVDPDYPKARIDYMLNHANVGHLLLDSSLQLGFSGVSATCVLVDEPSVEQVLSTQPVSNPNIALTQDNLAYLIYTSGSTGQPKGVMGRHGSLVNRVNWLSEQANLNNGNSTSREIFCQKTSVGFVDHIAEIFQALATGVPLVILSTQTLQDTQALHRAMNQWHISQITLVPSLLKVLLQSSDLYAPHVRRIFSSGEALYPDDVTHFSQSFPNAGLYNVYGSSEVGADVLSHRWQASAVGEQQNLTHANGAESVIGRCIHNLSAMILGSDQQPVPIGVAGELYVSGAGLARGYLNSPGLTAARFVPHPYSNRPGDVLYRTGDKVRQLANGDIVFLGRIDQQLNLRGLRVEPGEVETVITQLDGVEQCAVVQRDENLVAYVTANKKGGQALKAPNMSLFFFAADDANQGENKYQLYLDAVTKADKLGFAAVWTPERHFNPVAGLYPNPSVLSAALAMVTETIQLRAGSVVLPLHHPVRVAEEWSVVDNLSNGRVGLSFVPGWVPDDFVLAPDNFANKRDHLFDNINTVKSLWRGEAQPFENGVGQQKSVQIYPAPVQPELPVWLTCTKDAHMFQRAGEMGVNVITALLAQDIEEAAEKIAIYRQALLDNGHDPAQKNVTMMLHTFVLEDEQQAIDAAREPFCQYMRSHLGLIGNVISSFEVKDVDLNDEAYMDAMVNAAYERYLRNGSLIGSVQSCRKMMTRLAEIGVDEVACLTDFGLSHSQILESLDFISQLPLQVPSEQQNVGLYALKAHVQGKLPPYMTPSQFVFLDSMPTTPSGKLDKTQLPAPESLSQAYQAPETGIEIKLAGLWGDLLSHTEIGRDDNFFALGGHSLMVTQLISRIRDGFNVELSIATLFEQQTLFEQAQQIEQAALATSGSAVLKESALVPVPRNASLPLSYAQQRLWFLMQLLGPNPVYNIPLVLSLKGKINELALVESVSQLVERHESLRTQFSQSGMQIEQVILAQLSEPEIELVENEAELHKILAEERHFPFDLQQDALCRIRLLKNRSQVNNQANSDAVNVDNSEIVLSVTLHHIIADGWSMGIFFRDLLHLYANACGDNQDQTKTTLAPLTVQYADYAHWQRTHIQGDMLAAQLSYWREQLMGLPPLLGLPTDRKRPSEQTYVGSKTRITLSQTLSDDLKALSLEHNVTLFMTLLSAFSALLSQYSGQTDVAIGTPVANRTEKETEDMIGFFVNMLVMRSNLSDNPDFVTLLNRTREMALQAYQHQDIPFEQLVEELNPQRDPGHSPLFQVAFALQNVPDYQSEQVGFSITPYSETVSETLTSEETTYARFDLWLDMAETPQGLVATMEYNTDLFDRDTIAGMLGHFESLLQQIVLSQTTPLSALPLLSDQETQQQCEQWNKVALAPASPELMHQRVEQQAAMRPSAIALRDGAHTMSYQALNQQANQLAHYLVQQGIQAEDRIALCLSRGMTMVVAILAVLKAGAAYVPIATELPAERKRFIVRDAGAALLIADSLEDFANQGTGIAEQANGAPIIAATNGNGNVSAVSLDTAMAQQSHRNLQLPVLAEQLAYIIYTSGSTGQPKGTLVPHGNLCRLFSAVEGELRFTHQDVWTLFHSYAFDFSVWEIWGALIHGGELVIVPVEVTRSVDAFYQLLIDCQVTVLNQTPSMFYQVIAHDLPMHEPLLSLRWVIFGGEALDFTRLAPWFTRYHDQAIGLVNMYGITETTVHATCRRIYREDCEPAGDRAVNSDIGRKLSDLRLYLLDESLSLVPRGVVAELYIGGAGLARGYLNQPGLTASRFIADPIGTVPGQRLYRTGDLGRYLPDGRIEYLGRADQQVKVRGFRIELGEIESSLLHHKKISDVVVVLRQDNLDFPLLVAYLVGNDDTDQNVLRNELRTYLLSVLPEYMVPGAFEFLPALPLNANGKVDKRALPAPVGFSKAIDYEAPNGETETALAELWQSLLNVNNIGRYDNFFTLGGHSLLATQLIALMREIFEIDMPVKRIFERPTLVELAELIARECELNSIDDDDIANMSEEQVQALLRELENE